jgi:hypothetical protein
MTTWSVVKDDTKEKRPPARYFRYGILASIALLIISLGVALVPGTPPKGPEPAFSERARASALAEATDLRAAGGQLADRTTGAERLALLQTVTLLTTQARALMTPPGQGPGQLPSKAAAGGSSGTSAAKPSGTPSPAAVPANSAPASSAALAAALSVSGKQRLADAETADGGMARLLAATGAAQLLQASLLAPSTEPAETGPQATPPPAADTGTGSCAPSSGNTTLAAALAITVKTEAETVYGYQVALARLEGNAARSASELLARHESVESEAEALSRLHCANIPPREAGYTLGPLFIDAPAAGLGGLEAGTLPVYGDLVALSEGNTRKWAVSGLVAAARRAALWGADPGALPGIVVDTAQLPALPAGPAETATAAPATPQEPGENGH